MPKYKLYTIYYQLINDLLSTNLHNLLKVAY